MQVHLLSQSLPPFPSIHEFPAEFEAESDVVTATPPLPDPDVGSCCCPGPVGGSVDVGVVTSAGFDRAFRAGA